ncbi:MAG: DNA gyrase inhibitor YacG [bacterium]|nr:DNA gyrase inhibitor YacG [bacterium]
MTDLRCPVCARPTVARHAPFCSRRCSMKDLAHWVGAAPPFVIEGEPADPLSADADDAETLEGDGST